MLNIVNKWLSVTSVPLSFAPFFLRPDRFLLSSLELRPVLLPWPLRYWDYKPVLLQQASFLCPSLSVYFARVSLCSSDCLQSLMSFVSGPGSGGYRYTLLYTLCSHCCLNVIVQIVESTSQWEALAFPLSSGLPGSGICPSFFYPHDNVFWVLHMAWELQKTNDL